MHNFHGSAWGTHTGCQLMNRTGLNSYSFISKSGSALIFFL